MLRALNGEYVLPEAGGDLLRDGAGVLPTGAFCSANELIVRSPGGSCDAHSRGLLRDSAGVQPTGGRFPPTNLTKSTPCIILCSRH